MNDKPIKVNVTATDGRAQVTIGNPITILNDATLTEFVADNLPDFVEVVANVSSVSYVDFRNLKLEAYKSVDVQVPQFDMLPFASCVLSRSSIAKFIGRHVGMSMTDDTFLAFLRQVKDYLKGDSLLLLDLINNLSIKKLISIEKSKDSRGNYNFKVTAEKGGKEDFEFPKILQLEFPILEGLNEVVKLDFDFNFKWSVEDDGGVKLSFSITNLNVDELTKVVIKRTITEALNKAKVKYHIGSLNVFRRTDDWKYKQREFKM